MPLEESPPLQARGEFAMLLDQRPGLCQGWPKVDGAHAKFRRHRPNSGRRLPNFGRIRVASCRHRSNSVVLGPILARQKLDLFLLRGARSLRDRPLCKPDQAAASCKPQSYARRPRRSVCRIPRCLGLGSAGHLLATGQRPPRHVEVQHRQVGHTLETLCVVAPLPRGWRRRLKRGGAAGACPCSVGQGRPCSPGGHLHARSPPAVPGRRYQLARPRGVRAPSPDGPYPSARHCRRPRPPPHSPCRRSRRLHGPARLRCPTAGPRTWRSERSPHTRAVSSLPTAVAAAQPRANLGCPRMLGRRSSRMPPPGGPSSPLCGPSALAAWARALRFGGMPRRAHTPQAAAPRLFTPARMAPMRGMSTVLLWPRPAPASSPLRRRPSASWPLTVPAGSLRKRMTSPLVQSAGTPQRFGLWSGASPARWRAAARAPLRSSVTRRAGPSRSRTRSPRSGGAHFRPSSPAM